MFEWLFKTRKETALQPSAPRPSPSDRPSSADPAAALPPGIIGALQHHQAGRFAEAEAAYREVLAVDPGNIDATHFLGVIAYQMGKHEQAVQLISNALSMNARNAPAHNNLGNAFEAQGRLDEALACYESALDLDPDYVDALVNLGGVFRTRGKLEEATACFQKALALSPDAAAYTNLGNVFHDMGQLDEAIDCHRKALALKPDFPGAYTNMGNALRDQGQLDEAVDCHQKALALDPGFPEAYSNLGNILDDQGKSDDAIACYEKALALRPDFAEGHANLGNVLTALGRLDQAETSHRRAMSLRPESAYVRMSCALATLLRGDYQSGFPLYESRFEEKALSRLHAGMCARSAEFRDMPRWGGERAPGKTLLVWTDQGLGDSLMTARYLSRIKKNYGFTKLTVYCEAALVRLIGTVPDVDEAISMNLPIPWGEFDSHCPIMSLPGIFKTRVESIPNEVPYLFVPPEFKQKWAVKLAGVAPLRVGLVWAGGPRYAKNALRSIRLERFSPLLQVADAKFLSLQKGEEAKQQTGMNLGMLDWMDECKDLLDTAALIEQLDLVIGVDTAVAHLVGALGKPMWMLNRFESEWRWMVGREDSPWYPTLRIFRQPRPGEWDEVIKRAASALESLCESGRNGSAQPIRIN